MSKHTPGPWTARTKTTRFAVTSQHLTVAHVIGLDAAAKADARLIAAAPELLVALKYIEGLAMADEPRDLPSIAQIARAAIAKAEAP